MIDAHEAFRIGLVNRVVPAAELIDDATRDAQDDARERPARLAHCIEAVNARLRPPARRSADARGDGVRPARRHRRQARRHARLPREARRRSSPARERARAAPARLAHARASATFAISHASISTPPARRARRHRRERAGQDEPARVDLLPADPSLGARRARSGPRALRRRRVSHRRDVETRRAARDRRRLRARRASASACGSTAPIPERLSDALGALPSVMFSPADVELVAGCADRAASLSRHHARAHGAPAISRRCSAIARALARRNAALRDARAQRRARAAASVAVWEPPLASTARCSGRARRAWVDVVERRDSRSCARDRRDGARCAFGTRARSAPTERSGGGARGGARGEAGARHPPRPHARRPASRRSRAHARRTRAARRSARRGSSARAAIALRMLEAATFTRAHRPRAAVPARRSVRRARRAALGAHPRAARRARRTRADACSPCRARATFRAQLTRLDAAMRCARRRDVAVADAS